MPPSAPQGKINGPALRTIRERTGFTIVAFCDALRAEGITVGPDHISNVEAGRRGLSPEVIAAAARVLRCPQAAFLAEPDRVAS